MYKAKNGFTLIDSSTKWGWDIKNAQDILTALLGYPVFATVDTGIIWDAIDQATTDRKEYANLDEFVEFLAANYI